MSAIKFRKRLPKFKITIALPKKFGSKGFITVVKIIKIWRSSGESYKLRYVYPIWGTPGDIAIQKREIDYFKIKVVPLSYILVETVPLDIHRFKSKKGASVSEEFALFNWSSVGYIRSTICKVSIIQTKLFGPLDFDLSRIHCKYKDCLKTSARRLLGTSSFVFYWPFLDGSFVVLFAVCWWFHM